jgi:hypothetical protein
MAVPGLEATPNKRDVIFYPLLCKQGVTGSIPVTSTSITRKFNRLLIWPLLGSRNLGPSRSNKELLHSLDRFALFFRNRV